MRLAPDREYWMRLSKLGHFHFLRETLAGYRLHPESISYKEVSEEVSWEYLTVLDDYFDADDVPPAIAARRSTAYANAYLADRAQHDPRGRLSRRAALSAGRRADRQVNPLCQSSLSARSQHSGKADADADIETPSLPGSVSKS